MAVTLESLKKSVGKKNAKSQVFAWLADLELASGNVDAALQRVNGGLTLYPNDIAGKLVRSKIYFKKGEFEECVHECESILVSDPFDLAAQKIMGDAYDQLGNVAERNLCYRRYHDMDPLNKFWKDEYDIVPEQDNVSAATAGAASAMADDDFSLPADDDSLNLDTAASSAPGAAPIDLSDDFATGGAFSDGGFFEKSVPENLSIDDESPAPSSENTLSEGSLESDSFASDVGNSIDKAFGDTFGADADTPIDLDAATAAPAETMTLSDLEKTEEARSAGEKPSIEEPLSSDNNVPADNDSSADDPFAALAAMLPNNDSADDSLVDDLSASLDSVMDEIKASDSEQKPVEEFPVDDKVSGGDVNAALSNMFGLDDDLEPEEAAPAAPAIQDDASFGTETADASSILNAKSADTDSDKPMSVDDAFASIFGEDELPEEKPASSKPVEEAPVADSLSIEPATAEPLKNDDLALDNSAFEKFSDSDSLFDKSSESTNDAFEKSSESSSSLFDKSSDADSLFDKSSDDSSGLFDKSSSADGVFEKSSALETEVKEKASEPASDKPMSVDDAFSSIFGEDELPEEKPVDSKPVEADDLSLDAESLNLEPENVEPVKEDAKPLDDSAIGEWSPDPKHSFANEDDFVENVESQTTEELSVDAPALEQEPHFVKEVEEPSDPVIASPMDFVSEESKDVGSAFDSMFGEDDKLPEENAEQAPASSDDATTLADRVDQAEAELEMPSAESKDEPSDLAKEMGGAFASMFGDDDDLDLPEVNKIDPTAAPKAEDSLSDASAQQATSAALEEESAKVESVPSEDALAKDLDKSFDSLFGADDDLDLPKEESAKEPKVVDEPAAGNPDLSSLESEVSGAFKGLFDSEDDSLPEEAKPSNKGVDFLMSGDSDDEISAGLIKNPDAPLDRGNFNLDDSMSTRTLAEIYFEQGLYNDALKMYQELVQKDPNNGELNSRMAEIEKVLKEKFGDNA